MSFYSNQYVYTQSKKCSSTIHSSFHICIRTDQLAIEGYQLDGVEHENYPEEDMGYLYH